MMNITINAKKRTLEMTKAFEKKASIYGSEEYMILQAARKDYPSYKPVVKKVSTGDRMKGLTFEYMENYIKTHNVDVAYVVENDENFEEVTVKALEAFYSMTGMNNSEDIITEQASYGEIKKWFLEVYPEVKRMATNSKNIVKSKRVVKAAA